MFEYNTAEAMLDRCLERVSDNYDKREGSLIYDAIAPVVAELAQVYIDLGTTEDDLAFPDTMTGVNLTRKVREKNVERDAATRATRRGEFFSPDGTPMDVPIGSRYSGGMQNFTVTGRVEAGVFRLECEEEGISGNQFFGPLVPIDDVPGLGWAQLGEVLVPGEDEQSDESLYAEYERALVTQGFGGNIADYQKWTLDQPGVGGVKVYPVKYGGGTVGLVIQASDYTVPSAALVAGVQEAIDPAENQGIGLGLAPIDHRVTVEAVEGVGVTVQTEVQFRSGYSWPSVKPAAEEALRLYYSGLAALWQDTDFLVVRISQIEARLLDLDGVLDITGTRLNGVEANLELGAGQIPVHLEVAVY